VTTRQSAARADWGITARSCSSAKAGEASQCKAGRTGVGGSREEKEGGDKKSEKREAEG
jgi:hypothetical protein